MKKIFLLAIIALCASCNDNLNNPQWYVYAETQCADPWETGIGNSLEEVRNAVENYVEDQGICVREVELIDSEPGFISCQACGCPSGRGIRLKGETEDEAIFTDIGFSIE